MAVDRTFEQRISLFAKVVLHVSREPSWRILAFVTLRALRGIVAAR
jgi:hypothetical protein